MSEKKSTHKKTDKAEDKSAPHVMQTRPGYWPYMDEMPIQPIKDVVAMIRSGDLVGDTAGATQAAYSVLSFGLGQTVGEAADSPNMVRLMANAPTNLNVHSNEVQGALATLESAATHAESGDPKVRTAEPAQAVPWDIILPLVFNLLQKIIFKR